MSKYFPGTKPSGGRVKDELGLFNYATIGYLIKCSRL